MPKQLVVHCKRSEFDVYIGRPSKWGNPFSHQAGTLAKFRVGTRDQAVEAYRKYLLSNESLLADLHELKGKVLACWCYPQRCHGDVLAELANKG
jgi:hypothetical protein